MNRLDTQIGHRKEFKSWPFKRYRFVGGIRKMVFKIKRQMKLLM